MQRVRPACASCCRLATLGVPFLADFAPALASPFVAGRTFGTLNLSGRVPRPPGGSAVLRTRYVIAVLLGVGLATFAAGQEPRAFSLKFKNEKGEMLPFYQEMYTEVNQHIKVQGQ